MGNNKMRILMFLTLFLILYSNNYSQSPNGFDCGFVDSSGALSSSIFGNSFNGVTKPIRTDLSGDTTSPSSAVFPVIIVFVQYKNDIDDWQWPTNQVPIYLDSLIAQTKSYNSNWWDAYNEQTEPISDYWLELSRGIFHVTGKTFSVILDKFDYEYTSDHEINLEVWRKINEEISDWSEFDKWRDTLINNETKFYYEPDGYVDMIYKIHKNYSGPLWDKRGYAHLTSSQFDFSEVLVDTTRNIKIGYGYRGKGSGVTVSFTARKFINFNVLQHEHGHCLYANGHIAYGKVAFGAGSEGFFSPYEMILLKYQNADTVIFSSQVQYSLKDYSSRDNSNGEILRVPIQGNECFLLASRGHVSKWDRVMLGDTTQIIGPFEYNENYGKGLYIYHVNSYGIVYPNGSIILPQDLECADGLWYWSNRGQTQRYAWDAGYCFNASSWTYYLRDSVSYSNDGGLNYSPADGISHAFQIWAGVGSINSDACQVGTNRLFTNSEQIYPNEEVLGDRYDAWNVGYNEIFSPYSSPNTNTWANGNSGIFIWYQSFNSSTKEAIIKIYKGAVGEQLSLDSVLHLTPPSRPMGIKVDYYPESENYMRPIITWNHNQEPDMLRTDSSKRYRIWRATQSTMSYVPTYYILLKTLDINAGTDPEFIDTSIVALGSAWPGMGEQMEYPVRYTVQAV
ncbi:MAG: hypothetical protein JNJ56_14315, partial [Ignavibacteria bacterium]|nr:hypothetical protein [Ignavibacteria bacterium]